MSDFQAKLAQAVKSIAGVKIPDMPDEVIQLDKEMQSKFANTASIAGIIEKNTTLTGDVLKVVNSPAFKLNVPVTSIREAVEHLGMQRLYSSVVAAALKNMFADKSLVKDILDNSVDIAFCMAELSPHVQGVSRDEAYMLGLLHNVGALMLATKDEDCYSKYYLKAMTLPVSVIKNENEVFGSNHAIVGVLVAKKWKLAVPMMRAIMFHHNQSCANISDEKVRAMVAMLKIANVIVAEVSLGSYQAKEAKDYLADGVEELMLSNAVIKELRSALMTYCHKSAS